MKNLMIVLTLFISLTAKADIDEAGMNSMEPKVGEVGAARSCFTELEKLGCRHPREDLEQFKSCMENVYSSLNPACQKMMSELYRKKK